MKTQRSIISNSSVINCFISLVSQQNINHNKVVSIIFQEEQSFNRLIISSVDAYAGHVQSLQQDFKELYQWGWWKFNLFKFSQIKDKKKVTFILAGWLSLLFSQWAVEWGSEMVIGSENTCVHFINPQYSTVSPVQDWKGGPEGCMNDSKALAVHQAEWCPGSHMNSNSLLNVLKEEAEEWNEDYSKI